MILLPQLKTSFSSHLELMFIELFNSLGIKTKNGNLAPKAELSAKLTKEEGQTYPDMTVLTVDGINNIFIIFLPLLVSNFNYFYWKKPQLELLMRVGLLVNNNAHFTLEGFTLLINIIFSYSNKRNQSKEYWIELVQA